jgi:hypothetical protein
MEMRIIDDRGLIDLLFGLFCCELRYSAMSETDETVFGPSKPALIPSDAGALLLRGLRSHVSMDMRGRAEKSSLYSEHGFAELVVEASDGVQGGHVLVKAVSFVESFL